MADKKKTSQIVITLRDVQLGKRKLRYFNWICPSTMQVSQYDLHSEAIPLFLGADVLSSCSLTQKNLARTHAKFSSDGLSTKVYFPQGHKVNGLRGVGESAWFYSIQGLFRIAFEHYSRQEQKLLLENLKDIWISRLNDSFLIHEIKLLAINELGCDPVQSNMSSHCSDSETEYQEVYEPEIQPEVSRKSKTNNDMFDSCSQFKTVMNSNQEPQDTGVSDAESVLESLYSQIKSLMEKVRLNCSTISTRTIDDITSQFIIDLVDLLKLETVNIDQIGRTIFPIHLMRSYLEMKQKESIEGENQCEFQFQQELVLHVISGWLGEEMHSFQPRIELNVDLFKKNYLSSINNLPNPEDIINELYPSAMCNLLYNWIGVENEQGFDDDSAFSTSDSKLFGSSLTLFLLELLNKSPITGLGHLALSRITTNNLV